MPHPMYNMLPPSLLNASLGKYPSSQGTLTRLMADVYLPVARQSNAVAAPAPEFLHAPVWATVRLRGIAGDVHAGRPPPLPQVVETQHVTAPPPPQPEAPEPEPPLAPAAHAFADAVLASLEDVEPRPPTPDPTPDEALGHARDAVKTPPQPKGPPKQKKGAKAAGGKKNPNGGAAKAKGKLKAAGNAVVAAKRMQNAGNKTKAKPAPKPPDDGKFTCQTAEAVNLPPKLKWEWHGEPKEARSCVDLLAQFALGPQALVAKAALGVASKEEKSANAKAKGKAKAPPKPKR